MPDQTTFVPASSWRIGRVVLRRARVDDHVERLVLDLDEVGGVAGELARRGDDGDDRLADVADPADRERVVLDLRSPGGVVSSKNGSVSSATSSGVSVP